MSREYPERPVVGIGAVVWREDGAFLMIRRSNPPRQGQWSIPGGAQETGETIFEAAAREIFEECNVSVEIIGLIDALDLIDRDDDGAVRYHHTVINVVARYLSGETVAGSDAMAAEWFKLNQLASLELRPETERIIRHSHELWTTASPTK